MKQIRNLIMLGYDDYITSRHLVNTGFPLQAAIMASMAVEKYLKAFLVMMGKDLNKIKVHLDRLDKLKSFFENTEYMQLFTVYLDDRFLDQLSKAYRFRYYDNLKEATTVGFFNNQFLGELDNTIFMFERLIIMTNEKGENIDTHYKRALKSNDPKLFFNNYILNRIEKREFMMRKSDGFGLYFNPQSEEAYNIETKEKMNVPYDGKIMIVEATENK